MPVGCAGPADVLRGGAVSADLLRRAAEGMVAEAERLEAMVVAATDAPWERGCTCCEADSVIGPRGYVVTTAAEDSGGDLDLIAHRRNTLARDAATLRALADLIRNDADAGYEQREVVAIARAFLGEVTP